MTHTKLPHLIVVDLGYGDAGKGITVARLTEETPNTANIRYNGGAQAAHNVITADGRHHTFAQFGSGTFTPNVPTHLTKHFLLDLPALHKENQHLQQLGITDAIQRLTIDPTTRIITPYMIYANRIRETLRHNPHGSTGRGIGETVAHHLQHPENTIHLHNLSPSPNNSEPFPFHQQTLHKLTQQHEWLHDEFPQETLEAYNIPTPEETLTILTQLAAPITTTEDTPRLKHLQATTTRIIFEGAQGVLLDEHHGFHPHTTWSTTTDRNARQLAADAQLDTPETIGVTRTYHTRHGNGPFPTETPQYNTLPEPHNQTGQWSGAFRKGHLDVDALQYAINVCRRVDHLTVTHADYLPGNNPHLTPDPDMKLPALHYYQHPENPYHVIPENPNGENSDRTQHLTQTRKLQHLPPPEEHPENLHPLTDPRQIADMVNVPLHTIGFGPDIPQHTKM